jgi:hypothetical protein
MLRLSQLIHVTDDDPQTVIPIYFRRHFPSTDQKQKERNLATIGCTADRHNRTHAQYKRL